MDIYIFISVLSVMYCWILCTVLSAPAGETPTAAPVTQGRHVRTKRCSCSTFLDKECVYFCHLDIIWVNTPERVVSYGLGNAPRTKRAAAAAAAADDSMATGGGPRCQCLRENDSTCGNFCRLGDHLRTRSSHGGQVSPVALRAALETRLPLEKWRARQRHRARAWEGESAAS
ncbi:endothelin-1 isoform X1 [Xiphias gladius]|uniref:endothelin-1 isoform X1 n=1 Tax=Xiphias gladius TaxID=8245 RepID=UPI001A989E03|nr:endothelin-1 isoform X1 [Xiphias gladius]